MFISDTGLHTIEALGFDVVEDANFYTLVLPLESLSEAADKKLADADVGNTVTFPAGFRYEGRISAIQLHSGVIITL